MKFRFLFLIVLFTFLFSCSKPLIQTLNLKDAKEYNAYAMMYALPKTVINVQLEVRRTLTKKGLFADYADKYLSIKDAPLKDLEKWEITNVVLDNHAEVDSNHYYVVRTKDKRFSNCISLSKNGLIEGINTHQITPENPSKTQFVPNKETFNEVIFSDLSVKSNPEKTVKKKSKQQKHSDSGFVDVPVFQKGFVHKSNELKAEEAANFLNKLRKRRFQMVSADYDKVVFTEASLDIALKELARQEEEYLSLFIGKTFTETFTYNFEFTPDEFNKLIPTILCRFSATKGILESNNTNGTPLLIETASCGTTNVLNRYYQQQNSLQRKRKERKQLAGIFYRIPDESTIKILNGKEILASRKMTIAQYGTIAILPAEFLLNNYRIDFYTDYGTIKTIQPHQP